MNKISSAEHNDGRLAAIARGVQERKAVKAERAELRISGKTTKSRNAHPNSGKRKRQLARRKKPDPQEVVAKQEIERKRLLFKTMNVMMGIEYRNFCHEKPTSYRRTNSLRRPHKMQVALEGRNLPVQARVIIPTEPKYFAGDMRYRIIKKAYNQPQLSKGHDPYARPETVELTRRDVLMCLKVDVDTEHPTRIVPHRYVEKGGVARVKLFKIPVPIYRNPGAVLTDHVNRDEPDPCTHETVTFLDGAEKVRYIVRTLRDSARTKVPVPVKSFNDTVETRTEVRARRVLISEMHKEWKKDNDPKPFESDNDIVYSHKPRYAPLRTRFALVPDKAPPAGVQTKKRKRLEAVIARDVQRGIDFCHASMARNEARELAKPDYSAAVAANIAAFDNQKAKPDDPVKAGKKAAKLAAFKAKQAMRLETGAWPERLTEFQKDEIKAYAEAELRGKTG